MGLRTISGREDGSDTERCVWFCSTSARSLDVGLLDVGSLDAELAKVESGLVARMAEYRLEGNPVGEHADRRYLASVLEARAALCHWLGRGGPASESQADDFETYVWREDPEDVR